MVQTAPADQVVLWHKLEHREGLNLDRRLSILARGHRQEASRHQIAALHNPTDSERLDFRENALGRAVFTIELHKLTIPLS